LTPQIAKGAALRSYRGTVVVQRRADLSASSGCWFEIMPCWGSWDLTDTHGWLLGRCPPGYVMLRNELVFACRNVTKKLQGHLTEWVKWRGMKS